MRLSRLATNGEKIIGRKTQSKMEQNDFHLVDVVVAFFFFVSAASRKSYLVQLGMRKRGCAMQGGREGGGEKATRFLRER